MFVGIHCSLRRFEIIIVALNNRSRVHLILFADGFDIVVNDCYAHNGGNKRIQLIDQYGCPVDDKLISRFRGSWSESGLFETQVFAYMKTFRFTGSPALYIECDVRMCHGRCPVTRSVHVIRSLLIHFA